MKDIDWEHLTFSYTPTAYIIRSHYANGAWSKPYATTDPYIPIHAAAAALQYAQQAFEGLKAYRTVDNRVSIFRPEMNAKRMQQSAEAMYMAPVPTDLFIEACEMAVRYNIDYLPPFETGATLYLRPILFGTEPKIEVRPSGECEFCVVASPIGAYFPAGFGTTPCVINRHVDRASRLGTGQWKVGGNYASSFRATEPANEQGIGVLFLDSEEHKYLDECGAANILLVKDGKYVTPLSRSILPSIINDSLMTLCRDLGIEVEQRRITVEELSSFSEAAEIGTGAAISPISRIIDPDKGVTYEYGERPGKLCTRLYHAIRDIQYGRVPDTHGWRHYVDL